MTESHAFRASVGSLCKRIILRVVVGFGIWGGLLFGAAGTFAWPRAWVQLALWLPTIVLNFAILLRVNPAVVAARLEGKRGSARFERVMIPFFLIGTLAIPVIAGLDAGRFGWSSASRWTLWLGLILHVGGDAIMVWAMAVNPFLEKTVRIQKERHQQVVTTGPYALVRHPMYTGSILLMAGMPLVLGSWWTFVSVGLLTLGVIIRMFFEEALLRRELAGYEDYVHRRRYRLLPGIW
ncbi:MAG: isoprenylcysteine carboxylmethyltransferase family protein [Planctomycetes bacterium]|nr:isoprenylcysteine carboxylmethyltransferase family protein [Planctomycetota bacterium]